MDVCLHTTHTHAVSNGEQYQFSTEVTNFNCSCSTHIRIGTASVYWCFWSYNNNTIITNLFSVLMINQANTSETSRNRDDTFKAHIWTRNAKSNNNGSKCKRTTISIGVCEQHSDYLHRLLSYLWSISMWPVRGKAKHRPQSESIAATKKQKIKWSHALAAQATHKIYSNQGQRENLNAHTLHEYHLVIRFMTVCNEQTARLTSIFFSLLVLFRFIVKLAIHSTLVVVCLFFCARFFGVALFC